MKDMIEFFRERLEHTIACTTLSLSLSLSLELQLKSSMHVIWQNYQSQHWVIRRKGKIVNALK